ncbi:hypothetical protein Tco_0652432, partial [Tanacetum coccineum]
MFKALNRLVDLSTLKRLVKWSRSQEIGQEGVIFNIYHEISVYEIIRLIILRLPSQAYSHEITLTRLLSRVGTLRHTCQSINELYEVDYNKLLDYLKQNQAKANEIRASKVAKSHDSLTLYSKTPTQAPYALLANTPQKQTYPMTMYTPKQPLPLNNNIMQQLPLDTIIDVNDPMKAMQTTFALMSKGPCALVSDVIATSLTPPFLNKGVIVEEDNLSESSLDMVKRRMKEARTR